MLDLERGAGTRALEARDCRGRVVRAESVELAKELHKMEVPAAGVAVVR